VSTKINCHLFKHALV